MRTATATYHAPEGDSKVAVMGGVTFPDGEPVEINDKEHSHLMNKLPGNPHFEVEMGEDEPVKRGPGRPRKEPEQEPKEPAPV